MNAATLFSMCLDIADDPATSREQMVGVLRLAMRVEERLVPDPKDEIDPAYAHLTWEGQPFITRGIAETIHKFYRDRHGPDSMQCGKVPCIKWLRGETGCGLKEAKEAAEIVSGYYRWN